MIQIICPLFFKYLYCLPVDTLTTKAQSTWLSELFNPDFNFKVQQQTKKKHVWTPPLIICLRRHHKKKYIRSNLNNKFVVFIL